ncbi:MAG: hypothetical protein L6R30_26065 [Thermoanaerobaculia bacterium]|nr:hypothetical protein [Thermoanaerobaculia bacterium]
MKEARAIANGVFSFVIFLLIYGFFFSGHVRATGASGPRFLKMEINEGHHGDHVSFSMPFAFVRGSLRLAAMGNVRRELDLRIRDEVQSELLRDIWKELQEKPDGTPVTRELDSAVLSFTKNGSLLDFSVTEKGPGEAPAEATEETAEETTEKTTEKAPEKAESLDHVTIRLPIRIFAAMAEGDENLGVDTLLDELPNLKEGELLSVQSKDGTVRIWIE